MLKPLPEVDRVRSLASKAETLRDALASQIDENAKKIKSLENEESLLDLVSSLLRRLIDQEVMDGVATIEKLQTEGLQEIFHDQDIAAKATVKEERGKISVSLMTVEKTGDVSVEGLSLDSFGGSIMTMQEIFMRISVIYRRGLRPLLLLDETLAAVADKYVDRAAGFLATLSERLGMDILLVSHDDAVVGAAKHAYHVSKVDNRAVFKRRSPKGRDRED